MPAALSNTPHISEALVNQRAAAIAKYKNMSGEEILRQARGAAAREATKLITEGSVKLILGHYVTAQEIDAMRIKEFGK